ncbi:MAG: hypothetical protein IJV04_02980 [Lachnospiraceae bacterium]|nr:hypothetical protein [Lachnospiraceae bacterium]
MTYEQFLTDILTHIQERLPASTEVELRKIQKNNDQLLDGLVFCDKDANASPTIYLNGFYKKWEKEHASIEEICAEILVQYEQNRIREPMDFSFFSDFAKLKDHIIFRIINRELNTGLLSDIPHIDYLDLSITFLVLLSLHEESDATITISNAHMAMWGTNTEELFSLAKQNTPRLLSWDMSSMRDVLSSLDPSSEELLPRPDELAFPMYVLTNRIRVHGAGCILYDNLLSQLSREVDDDLYIIPSSIHEVLLIPRALADEEKVLNSMICEVNRTQVPHDEILSDHVYRYSRARDAIVY